MPYIYCCRIHYNRKERIAIFHACLTFQTRGKRVAHDSLSHFKSQEFYSLRTTSLQSWDYSSFT